MNEFLSNNIGGTPIKVKYIVYTFLTLFLLTFGKCTFNKTFKRVTIDAGHVGVVVSKPVFFGKQGVTGQVFKSGSHWFWKSNEIIVLDTKNLQVTENFEDMFTSDNIPVDFGMQATFKITDYAEFVKSWGNDWYKNNTAKVFRAAGREECKKHTMSKLVSDPVVPGLVSTNVLEKLQAHTKALKMPIVFSAVTLDNISPNEDVKLEIGATAIQQQRQRTEGEKKLAEDMRKKTEVSRAAADNAYREAMNLGPEQYIRLEAVKAYSHAAEVCAKNQNCTMILTQPGNTNGINIPVNK